MKRYQNNEIIIEALSFIITFIIVAIFVILIDTDTSLDKYNNGICSECGGNYEFQTIIGHRYTNDYIYKCDKCGNLIEESSYHKPPKMEENK